MESRSWEVVPVPRALVTFPMSFAPGRGFAASNPARWPRVPGRLEFYEGRLHYMPPCGEAQAAVAANVVYLLVDWARAHAGFEVGGNEAGMLLGGAVRGADAAVWRSGGKKRSSGFRRKPPVLAVEVGGEDEDEAVLTEKARWYLEHGVETVWLVFPEQREVVVVTNRGRKRQSSGRLPAPASLPELSPALAEIFR
jgi:Uma2 family endonuclease